MKNSRGCVKTKINYMTNEYRGIVMCDELLNIIVNSFPEFYTSTTKNSFSCYSSNNKKADGVLRISDKWNHKNTFGVSCKTDVYVKNDTHWTLAKYDLASDTYVVLNTYVKLNKKKANLKIVEQIRYDWDVEILKERFKDSDLLEHILQSREQRRNNIMNYQPK